VPLFPKTAWEILKKGLLSNGLKADNCGANVCQLEAAEAAYFNNNSTYTYNIRLYIIIVLVGVRRIQNDT